MFYLRFGIATSMLGEVIVVAGPFIMIVVIVVVVVVY